MKTIVLLLTLMPLICNSQAITIESFNGIKFGTSRQMAITTAQETGASVVSINELEELVYLRDLHFAGISSKAAYLKFVDDQFYEGIMEFDIGAGSYQALYNRLKLAISNNYGYGKDCSWMDSPYYFGDGFEFRAILESKGKLCHVWAKGRQIASNDFIFMELGADQILRIVFQNHAYASIASKKIQYLEARNK